MFYNAKESQLQIGDTKMSYASFGNGDKTMVIIPGLSLRDVKGAGLGLAYMYRKFTKEYTVYVFDRKDDIPEGYTVKDIADDVAEGMRQLGLKNAYVFGVSQGGMVVQYLALNYPELVKKLVLGVTLSRNNETVTKVVNHWIEQFEQAKYTEFVEDMLRNMYSEAYIRKYSFLFPILIRFSVPKNMERFMRLAKACMTCDTYDRLTEIKCPVLILGGSKDLVTTGQASVEMAEKLGCEIYMYENLGHSAYEEAADFNDRIYDFFQS